MKFKDWLQNEIDLNLNKHPESPSPTQASQATQGVAQSAMAKFGPDIVKDLGSAPNTIQAGKVAVNYAQKALKNSPQKPSEAPTNALSVGANIFKQATGQDLKTMGKK